MWCDLDVNGQTVRVFNNHLQTTEVSQNKRRLERELAKNELTGREEAVARQLLEGLNENFRKRAAQAKTLEQLIRTPPTLYWFAVTLTLSHRPTHTVP